MKLPDLSAALPSLMRGLSPVVRELVSGMTELAGSAHDLGPMPLPEAFARLYAAAEDAHQLPNDLVAAVWMTFPADQGAAAADPAAFRDHVWGMARAMAEARAEGCIGCALKVAAVARGSDDPRRDAGVIAGTWQLLIARRLDPQAVNGLAKLFRS